MKTPTGESTTPTKATGLFQHMSKDQLDTTAKVAALSGISFEAASTLQICREYLRDWCPPDERLKVAAILVAIEGGKTS
jgi:hypothetical protein